MAESVNSKGICKVCCGSSRYFGATEILGKYDVKYFRCTECGLVETEEPHWLAEAYSDAIADSDIGLVGRNLYFARQTQTVLRMLMRSKGRFIDYGGGYGLFVRLMRDAGFDFLRYDTFCPNLFAKGFDIAGVGGGEFDLLTAFEVFEHLINPREELSTMLAMAPNILFSTCLIDKHSPLKPGEWWYYAPQTGQHVTLYTFESLKCLAELNGLHFYSAGQLHLFTKLPVRKRLFEILFKYKTARIAAAILPKRKSLLVADFHKLTGQSLS